MKIVERKRLHGLTTEQLTMELTKAERDLLRLRFDAGLNKQANPAGLHATRKMVATLKTLIRQHELLEETKLDNMEQYKVYRISEQKTYNERRKLK